MAVIPFGMAADGLSGFVAESESRRPRKMNSISKMSFILVLNLQKNVLLFLFYFFSRFSKKRI